MYSHLLVTLDGTARSEAVIPHAVAVATGTQARVTLLRVVEATSTDWGERGAVGRAPATGIGPQLVADAHDYLEQVAGQLRRTVSGVQVDVRQGHAAKQIVAAAREVGADAIAMATHSRRGINRLMFGSVAEAVLHESSLPVLLVRC